MSNIKRKITKKQIEPFDMEKNLLTLIRTYQLWQQRFKDQAEDYIYINSEEIAPYLCIEQKLIAEGKLSVMYKSSSNGNNIKYYKTTESGPVNFNCIKPKNEHLSGLHSKMMNCLMDISLSLGAPSTSYFNAFLFYRSSNPRIFFSVDSFSQRVHTPVTSFSKEFRKNILIKNEETVSLDVCTMQPLILGKILEEEIGENDFSNWINSGKDIYQILMDKIKLESRKVAKEKFYAISYGKSSDDLRSIFGHSNWVNWIDQLKNRPLASNPHTHLKEHSNLAWLMQATEVKILSKAWKALVELDVPFLTVHDEIIIRKSDLAKAEEILSSVLRTEFKYFTLNHSPPPEPDG